MQIVYAIIGLVQFVIAVALITVVTMQESKNEGLQGQIGTAVASSFKGKAGREEHLNTLARNLGIAFMVICVLAAVGGHR